MANQTKLQSHLNEVINEAILDFAHDHPNIELTTVHAALKDARSDAVIVLRNAGAMPDEDDEPEVFDPTDPMSRLYENEVIK